MLCNTILSKIVLKIIINNFVRKSVVTIPIVLFCIVRIKEFNILQKKLYKIK